jgi:hypothetical protein
VTTGDVPKPAQIGHDGNVLSRLSAMLWEYRLVVALVAIGLVVALVVGLAAGSVASAGYVGIFLGVGVGMAIAFIQGRKQRAEPPPAKRRNSR